jgi:hypothetical protein
LRAAVSADKRTATGTLHVAGHRGGEELTLRLSRPRYNAAQRTVSYAVKRMKGRLPSGAAGAAPGREPIMFSSTISGAHCLPERYSYSIINWRTKRRVMKRSARSRATRLRGRLYIPQLIPGPDAPEDLLSVTVERTGDLRLVDLVEVSHDPFELAQGGVAGLPIALDFAIQLTLPIAVA